MIRANRFTRIALRIARATKFLAKGSLRTKCASDRECDGLVHSRTPQSAHHPHKSHDEHCKCNPGGGVCFAALLGSDTSYTTLSKIPLVDRKHFQRAENGGLDPPWLNLAFQSRGPQILVLKGFGDLWKERWGAPKTPNSTTTDPTPHSRPSEGSLW